MFNFPQSLFEIALLECEEIWLKIIERQIDRLWEKQQAVSWSEWMDESNKANEHTEEEGKKNTEEVDQYNFVCLSFSFDWESAAPLRLK